MNPWLLVAGDGSSALRKVAPLDDGATSSVGSALRLASAVAYPGIFVELVTLDADPSVIKKVGDALRLANHPDHATSEGDRQRREAMSKRVNAALEFPSGKRKAA